MKSIRRPQKPPQDNEPQSEDIDCSCQLLDTSLSDVGDSDCSCSECLEANLQAFNELKEEEEQREKEEITVHRGASTRPASNKQTRGVSRNTGNQNKSTAKIGGFKSVDRMRETRPKTAVHKQQGYTSQVYENGESVSPKFSRECVNDYLRITQHRARSYLIERNGLKKSEEQKRNQLKKLIKQNLQALKYTAKNLVSGNPKNELSEQIGSHNKKRNHQPYHYKSRIQCKKLRPYKPDLQAKQEEIQAIEERIKKYKQANRQKTYQCPDKCPKHHMRTSKKDLVEIEKFIKKKAKDYQEAQERAKAQKKQKLKVKEAKLRAIDLKCKEKVSKSKKYDPQQQRTSFHNSIDHFSTFSELRVNNQERIQERKQRKKVKAAIKDGKQLQQAIYEDLEEDLVGDHPPIHSKINVESRYVQGKGEQQEEWCEKIVKDARIKPPKQLKKDDKQIKKMKERKIAQQKERQNTNKSKPNLSTRDLKKEEQRRKEIQAEIEKKKQQLLNHYQKRNSTANKYDPKNKQLREEYEEELKKQSRQSNKANPKERAYDYDPYRQVYKHEPGKDPTKMNIVGDPLMHEFEYESNSKRAKQLKISPANKEIFMGSGKQLMQKKVLKV